MLKHDNISYVPITDGTQLGLHLAELIGGSGSKGKRGAVFLDRSR